MKRQDTEEHGQRQKRARAGQACSSCRKSKARCDFGMTEGASKCHRCAALSLPCSLTDPTLSDDRVRDISSSSPPVTAMTPVHGLVVPKHTPHFPNSPAREPSSTGNIPPPPWAQTAENKKNKGKFDWAGGAPMQSISDLLHTRPKRNSVQLNENETLETILTSAQIGYLLDMYHKNYAPWVNLPPLEIEGQTDVKLLNLVRCSISSRHLDSHSRALLAPRLEALTQRHLLRHMFQPSTTIIHALIMRSFWTPMGNCVSGDNTRDGILLAASATNLAANMRLSEASTYARQIRVEKPNIPEKVWATSEASEQLLEATHKARLWIALSNVESILCIGSGRKPLSSRSEADNNFIEISALKIECIGPCQPSTSYTEYDINTFTKDSSLAECRDVRLGITARMAEIVENGLAIHLTHVSKIETFFVEINLILDQMKTLLRIINPLPLISSHEVPYFHFLKFYHHTYRMLMYLHVIRETRTVLQSSTDTDAWFYSQHNGQTFVIHWIVDAGFACEELLTAFLAVPTVVTSSAPDIIFSMLALGAIILMLVKSALWEMSKVHLAGYSEGLLNLVLERLEDATLDPDHSANRCVALFKVLLRSWAARTSSGNTDRLEILPLSSTPERDIPNQSFPNDPSLSLNHQHQHQHYHTELDAFLDTSFWLTFMGNCTDY